MRSVDSLSLFLCKDTGDKEAGTANHMTSRGLQRLTSNPAVALAPYFETVAEDSIEEANEIPVARVLPLFAEAHISWSLPDFSRAESKLVKT